MMGGYQRVAWIPTERHESRNQLSLHILTYSYCHNMKLF